MKSYFACLCLFLLLLAGCDAEDQSQVPSAPAEVPSASGQRLPGCRGCHVEMMPDTNHAFACTSCHQGNDTVSSQEQAHQGLVAQPAHPASMEKACGSCHSEHVDNAQVSVHFTLHNKINLVRRHFGSSQELTSLTQIPVTDNITTKAELADDMLRRRCLRCHVYSPGDPYPYVYHGTGCAACHLQYQETRLVSHQFSKPDDRPCLSCHNSNYVGSDYHGKFANDFNWEYRTPYATRAPYLRPYGVEQLNLAPDIHQQKGLLCRDCHPATGHQEKTTPPLSCATCHQWQPGTPLPAQLQVKEQEATLVLTGKADGTLHPVPKLLHPAHQAFGQRVDCQVCHAQWFFNDMTTHLMLSAYDDYDMWERLTVQGSYAVEYLLEHNLYSDEDELLPVMADGISGVLRPGVWYKGFTQRRWETAPVQRDDDGIIKIFRPVLDLRLSMVDEDEEVLFDNATGNKQGMLPYTPHTTGKAGAYYRERFRHLLPEQTP